MKYTCFAAMVAVLMLAACRKDHSCRQPDCIQAKIDSFSSVACKTGSSSVKRYNFQGKDIYTFDMSNCGSDMPIDVYDSECNYQGFLGGISGNSKINGAEFSTATYILTVWPE